MKNPLYQKWSNPSVLALAVDSDPIEKITRQAKIVVQQAIQKGWNGPPFNPFELAKHLGIDLTPRGDIPEARIIPTATDHFRIEYNPRRPKGRIRFSIAHEIAHTLFPDCSKTARNRLKTIEYNEDDWQLELLCNVAAAEFLMPVGSELNPLNPVTIDNLLRLQKQFDVSTESIAIRLARITQDSCTIFVASDIENEIGKRHYFSEYFVPSRTCKIEVPHGTLIEGEILNQCTAVGYTAKGFQTRLGNYNDIHLECAGIPPYPGHTLPRVVSIASSKHYKQSGLTNVLEIFGNALEPRGTGKQIIVHIVNDKTANWGAGFGRAVKEKYPDTQIQFRNWIASDKNNLKLGNIYISEVSNNLSLVQMIAQHGYGDSSKPRIRYDALINCLKQVKDIANKKKATIHMPRIGTGYAGGNWYYILELIDENLIREGIPVTVYSLPDTQHAPQIQSSLNLNVNNVEVKK